MTAPAGPAERRTWSVGDHADPQIIAVADRDGDRWERHPDATWAVPDGDPISWQDLLHLYGPVTDATGQPAEPRGTVRTDELTIGTVLDAGGHPTEVRYVEFDPAAGWWVAVLRLESGRLIHGCYRAAEEHTLYQGGAA